MLATIVLDANDLLGPLLRLLQETATQEGAAGPHEQRQFQGAGFVTGALFQAD